MNRTLRIPCIALAGLLAAAPGQSLGQARLELPAGGWRATPAGTPDFQQAVNYPAANVNAEGVGAVARIQGRMAASPKALGSAGPRRPARLVVDGIAMPLSVEADGRFARPWAFGSGSHGVQVSPPGGGAGHRVQFYEAATRTAARLRLVLSWDTDQTDLDLHVISPDGQHVFYGDRVAANGGALDVDVTTGFGPEIYASPAPPPGLWHVYVNYFGGGDGGPDVITVAQLAVVTDEGTPREKQQVFRVPMRRAGELTRVRSFRLP